MRVSGFETWIRFREIVNLDDILVYDNAFLNPPNYEFYHGEHLRLQEKKTIIKKTLTKSELQNNWL